jgi:hypothetical protein
MGSNQATKCYLKADVRPYCVFLATVVSSAGLISWNGTYELAVAAVPAISAW